MEHFLATPLAATTPPTVLGALAANTEGSVNTAISFNAQCASNTEGETKTAAGGNALF